MAVWALGLNHHTAPLDLRGRFAFAIDQIAPALHGLRQSHLRHPEAAILSTCNRTEVYCASDNVQIDHTLGWLAKAGDVSPAALHEHTYVLQNDQAARHAFRGASGLDSMVLGEAQILGQMKNAVRAAEDAGALGTTLNQLFQRSFAVAKEVRTSTDIGAHSISMAAAAVRLAGNLFEDLRQIKVLFVGAGEMIELAATHFAARQPQAIAIANRTLERGEKLATRFGAEVMRQADDGQGAGGAADDGVEFVQALGQLGQAHHLGTEAGGQLFAPLQRAVGDGDGFWALGGKVSGRQLDHLAGADKQHLDLAQVFKQVAGQAHGGGGHADGMGADFGR